MKFVKMHGCGNDYVYVDAMGDPSLAVRLDRPDWAELVRRISDRHKGVGSDGVIAICPPSPAAAKGGADARMRMFNADGSESEMCGNGIRCVAKFAHDRLCVLKNPMRIETGRGVLSIAYELDDAGVRSATVDMGEPILELERIPVDARHIREGTGGASLAGDETAADWRFVSMGNPHAVSFGGVEGMAREDALTLLARVGPRLERHAAFPRRANIHLVDVVSRTHARVYTWERGAGITQACGTGICAALVAGVLANRLDREATMGALGGDLRIKWDAASHHVFMTGEAVEVFEGEWPEE